MFKFASGIVVAVGIASASAALSDTPVGFASLNGGTDGGKGGAVRSVTTGNDLQALLKKGASGLIISVEGTITPSNSPSEEKINVKEVKNITITGSGTKGVFDGVGIKITKASNIILRNLVIHHVNVGEKDCISIEGPVNNVWIDHCEVYNDLDNGKNYYDGLLDAKDDAAYITVSRCYFHHGYKAVLVGYTTSDTYDRKMTMHHNYFLNCNSRLPSYRGGTGHVFNNLFISTIAGIGPTGVNSRLGAKLRIEGNCFLGIGSGEVDDEGDLHLPQGPIGAYFDAPGFWDVKDNMYVKCKGNQPTTSTCSFEPPYSYTLMKASEAIDNVLGDVGAQGSKPEKVTVGVQNALPLYQSFAGPSYRVANGHIRFFARGAGDGAFDCYSILGRKTASFAGTPAAVPVAAGFFVIRPVTKGDRAVAVPFLP